MIRRTTAVAWGMLVPAGLALGQGATLTGIGSLPSAMHSEAFAVSADGTTVVGACFGGADRAFRWRAGAGMEDLGLSPGSTGAAAFGVSADGSVVVGDLWGAGQRAFRWTGAGGMVELGFMPGS